jgi:hypothetical protein
MATAAASKVTAREALRARIQARAAAKVVVEKAKQAGKKFATLKRIAIEEPQEVDGALGQLAEGFGELSQALQSMSQNLDLGGVPATASHKARLAAKKNYAARFRRIAEEAPEQFEMAYNEVYQALDGLAEDMENAADNLGIALAPPMTEEAPAAEAAPFGGEETPAEEHLEEEVTEEAPAEEVHEEEEVKESSGSDWFTTDRDETGKPKAPTVASARKSVVQVRK